MDATDITWVDRRYSVPETLPAPGITGAQECARALADAVTAWGHTVAKVTYTEETAADAEGRITDSVGPRAWRAEFTADGRPVIVRHDSQTYSCPWSVTVDGQPQECPSTLHRTLPERVRLMALAVHRAAH